MTSEPYDWSVQAEIVPFKNKVLVTNMEHGSSKTPGGIIIPDDDGKPSGIRPRYCTVYAVGREIDYIRPGDKIFVAHGRWSRGVRVQIANQPVMVVRMVDPLDILLVFE